MKHKNFKFKTRSDLSGQIMSSGLWAYKGAITIRNEGGSNGK